MRTPWGPTATPKVAINIVVTLSPWISDINMRVDTATREEPQVDLTSMLCCPYFLVPSDKFRDHC